MPIHASDEKMAMPEGPIEKKTVDEIRPESLSLPPGFDWKTVTIDDDVQVCKGSSDHVLFSRSAK